MKYTCNDSKWFKPVFSILVFVFECLCASHWDKPKSGARASTCRVLCGLLSRGAQRLSNGCHRFSCSIFPTRQEDSLSLFHQNEWQVFRDLRLHAFGASVSLAHWMSLRRFASDISDWTRTWGVRRELHAFDVWWATVRRTTGKLPALIRLHNHFADIGPIYINVSEWVHEFFKLSEAHSP